MAHMTRRICIGLACLIASAIATFGAPFPEAQRKLESGLAVTHPETIEILDLVFGVGPLLGGRRPYGAPMYNDNLFAPPDAASDRTRSSDGYRKIDVSPIRDFVEAKIAEYETKRIPGSTIGQDSTRERLASLDKNAAFPDKVMDTGFLDRVGRFQLVAVVNRMDRIDRDPESCGELRFIYRLYYEGETIPSGNDVGKIDPAVVRSRLPMTLNLILKMRAPGDTRTSCRDIARLWLEAAKRMVSMPPGRRQADYLVSAAGPLNPKLRVRQAQFDRIEFNLQILRAPASYVEDFGTRADYLLAIFRFDGERGFRELKPLENQINRELLLGPDRRGTPELDKFRAWLLEEGSLRALDRGTIRIDEAYTARSAISVSPGGAARSNNQHVFGLFDEPFENSNARPDRAREPFRLAARIHQIV